MGRFFAGYLMALLLAVTGAGMAQTSDEFNLDQVYTISEGGTIQLNSDDAEVTVTGTDRNDVRVTVYYRLEVTGINLGSEYDDFEMEVIERRGDLVIREKPRRNTGIALFGTYDEDYEIYIEAPSDVHFEAEGDDEQYRISAIDGSINIDADDTDIALANCRGEEFIFNLDDGRLEMDQGRGSLDIEVDDGEVEVQNGTFNTINLTADDGDIRLTTSLADRGSYRFDMDDGDLELNISGGGGRFEIDHDDPDIRVDSPFEIERDNEDYTTYILGGGNAVVRIDVDDTDIRLRTI